MITFHKCPNCGKVLDLHTGPPWDNDELKGESLIVCPKCSQIISDGMKEWDNRSAEDKRKWVWSGIWGTFSVMLIALPISLGLAFLIQKILNLSDDQSIRLVHIFIVPLALLFGGLMIRGLRKEFKESKQRTAKKNDALPITE